MSSRLQSDSMAIVTAEDLTLKQNRFVKIETSGTVVLCTSGVAMLGILENAPDTGEIAEVSTVNGQTTKLMVAGIYNPGQALKSDANGKGLSAGTDKDKVGAILLEASTADGDICEVMIARYDIAV